MLAKLPEGAEIVVEIDLARLRANEVIGDLATFALGAPIVTDGLGANVDLDAMPLARADALVLASYRIGTDSAITHGLYVGGDLTPEDVDHGVALGDGVVATTPDAAELLSVLPDHAMADDEAFLRLRTSAMPAKAEGATVRVTARLGFDARVRLAAQLDIEAAPSAVSAWGDVADDLAVVAIVDAGADLRDPMIAQIRGWFGELAAQPAVRALGLGGSVEAFEVEPHGDVVHVIALIGPSRLERAAGRARKFLQLTGGS